MERFWDWEARLIAYIEPRERLPFSWGKLKQDCCSFANGGAIAMTGHDAMADIPDYCDAPGADEILLTPLEELMDARFPRVGIGFARRGDIAIAELRNLDTLMIVEGAHLVGPGKRGLVRIPRGASENGAPLMRAAWAVG